MEYCGMELRAPSALSSPAQSRQMLDGQDPPETVVKTPPVSKMPAPPMLSILSSRYGVPKRADISKPGRFASVTRTNHACPPHHRVFHLETRRFLQDVKTMGSWTRALQKQEGDNLVVHVDGLYGGSPLSSLASMKAAGGFQRVLLFAGGSGVTSFTALIQVR